MSEAGSLSSLLQEARARQAARDYPGLLERLSGADPGALLEDPELGFLLAEALRRAGERERALELARDLEPVCLRRGNDLLFRRRSNLEGILLFELGDVDGAEAEWGRLLDASSRAGDEEFIARANQNLGIIQTLMGQREAALASHERAIISYQRLGYMRGLAQAHNNLAISYREMGFADEAGAAFRQALEFARADGSQDEVARIEQEWALLEAMRDDGRLAQVMAERSLRRFRELGEPAGEGDALRVLGIVALWDGRLEEARERLDEAAAIARERHLRLLEAETLEARAALADAREDESRGASLRCDAEKIFAELHAVEWGRQIRARLAARTDPSPRKR